MDKIMNWLHGCLPDSIKKFVEFHLDPKVENQFESFTVINEVCEPESNVVVLVLRDAVLEYTFRASRNSLMNALVLHTSVKGVSEKPYIWKNEIVPLRLFWKGLPELRVRYVDGGTSEHYYPPRAYTEHSIKGEYAYPLVLQSGDDGRSSNLYLPLLQVGTENAGIVATMEWSGIWNQRLETIWGTGTHVHKLSIPVEGLYLAEGETLELPAIHLVFYEGELDEGGNAFRAYVRETISPDLGDAKNLPPVSYDHWFGIDNQIDEAFLMKLADRSRQIGVEYFVVDAGWFPVGFPDGVGNWHEVDRTKFPNGLEPLASYVRSLGLKFGLWFEMERAHVDSHIYRTHPELFMTVPSDEGEGIEPYVHLDLSKVEAQQWVIDTLGGWIERLDLKWSRWDYNIGPKPYWRHADPTGKKMFKYMAGLYRVLDVLREKYPDWLIEGCASGGRRFDLGILRRAHTYWFSDQTLYPDICRYMQGGAGRFFPGHLLNSAVTVPAIGAGDAGFTDTDVFSRMLGALSFNGDISSWSEEWTTNVRKLVEFYKQRRWLLQEKFYALTPPPTQPKQPDIVQFVSRDGSKSIIYGFVTNGKSEHRVYPKGLIPNQIYELRDEKGIHLDEKDGFALMENGLLIDLLQSRHCFRELIKI